METDITCMDCGKGTRHFELGEIYYATPDPEKTLLVKETIHCPKCRKNISDRKCKVKLNHLMMSVVAANVFRVDLPKHLEGAHHVSRKDYEQIKDSCKTRLVLVTR